MIRNTERKNQSLAQFIFAFSLITFSSQVVYGHGAHTTPAQAISWGTWTVSWPVIITLILISLYYLTGWKRVLRLNPNNTFKEWQLLFFILGILTLVFSLLSPIDVLSDYLASVHMIQHTLLLMVAAPFFALASPGFYSFRQLPRYFKRGVQPFQKFWFRLTRPIPIKRMFVAWVFYAFILWIWHVPVMYEAALQNSLIHDLQHLAFFISAYFFWRVIIDPFRQPKKNEGIAILYTFVASLHAMILGVLMTLAPNNWYPSYEETAPLFGFTALEDQQLAGLIMWMPAGVSYVLVALLSLYKLINRHNQVVEG